MEDLVLRVRVARQIIDNLTGRTLDPAQLDQLTDWTHCWLAVLHSGGMVLVTVFGKFGDRPSLKLFRCVACEFLDWVKA